MLFVQFDKIVFFFFFKRHASFYKFRLPYGIGIVILHPSLKDIKSNKHTYNFLFEIAHVFKLLLTSVLVVKAKEFTNFKGPKNILPFSSDFKDL